VITFGVRQCGTIPGLVEGSLDFNEIVQYKMSFLRSCHFTPVGHDI